MSKIKFAQLEGVNWEINLAPQKYNWVSGHLSAWTLNRVELMMPIALTILKSEHFDLQII